MKVFVSGRQGAVQEDTFLSRRLLKHFGRQTIIPKRHARFDRSNLECADSTSIKPARQHRFWLRTIKRTNKNTIATSQRAHVNRSQHLLSIGGTINSWRQSCSSFSIFVPPDTFLSRGEPGSAADTAAAALLFFRSKTLRLLE